jgi:hypothetical protein
MSKGNQIIDAFTLVFFCYDCSVSIATQCRQDSQESGFDSELGPDTFLVFSVKTGCWASPTSYPMGTRGSVILVSKDGIYYEVHYLNQTSIKNYLF